MRWLIGTLNGIPYINQIFQIFLRNFDYLSMFLADNTIRILCIYPAASQMRSSYDINNTHRHHEVAPALVSVR